MWDYHEPYGTAFAVMTLLKFRLQTAETSLGLLHRRGRDRARSFQVALRLRTSNFPHEPRQTSEVPFKPRQCGFSLGSTDRHLDYSSKNRTSDLRSSFIVGVVFLIILGFIVLLTTIFDVVLVAVFLIVIVGLAGQEG